jgi:hypothetical protein
MWREYRKSIERDRERLEVVVVVVLTTGVFRDVTL